MSFRLGYVGQNTSQKSVIDLFECKAPFLGKRKGGRGGRSKGVGF